MFLKPYIDSQNINKIKFVLTLMNISRTIGLKKDDKVIVDTSSITDPSPKKYFYTIPGWFIKEWAKNYKLELKQHKYTTKDFFITLKAGPHGPSILSLYESIKYLTSAQLRSIQLLINDDSFFVKYVGRLYSFVMHNHFRIPRGSELYDLDHKETVYEPITGKISIVKDPEYKMRLIAISDYMSQFVLKPIHSQLLNLLRKLPCDRTFTQDPKHKWYGPDKFHSLDLSSATDRFPIHLQQKLLQFLFVPDKVHKLIGSYWFAKAWRDLISDRNFLFEGKQLKYAVGQPMGSYSSWAAFTLTHHLVVAWAAHLVYGCVAFDNYIILGDDIVIKDDKVAQKYKKIMNKLGVSISPHKTHVSKNTYEFAKRWIKVIDDKFIELSPLPLKGIALNIENPFIVFTIIYDYFINKGNLCLVRGTLRSLVGKLYQGVIFKEYNKETKRFRKISFKTPYLLQRLELLDFGMRYSSGFITYDRIRFILSKYSKNQDWYMIPWLSTIHLETKRVLGLGVQFSVLDGIHSISNLSTQVQKYYALFNLEDMSILSSFPIFSAIRNYLERIKEVMDSYEEDDINLVDLSSEINFLDLSELAIWNRNYHKSILNGSKLWSKSLRNLDKEAEQQIEVRTWNSNKITMSSAIAKFDQQFAQDKEKDNFINLRPEMFAVYRTMAKRHGYAFLK
jgi:hypothetical protein